MNKTKARRFFNFQWTALPLTITVITLAAIHSYTFAATPTDSTTEIKTVEVKIDNFAFTPAIITVKAGSKVTWTNQDDIPHTVDSTQGKFKSAALDTNDKFEFRFTDPGEYPYFCRMHPKMTGKIIVQP